MKNYIIITIGFFLFLPFLSIGQEIQFSKWSTKGQIHVSPLEEYPNLGISGSSFFNIKKIKCGLEIVYYFPKEYNNVKRNIYMLNLIFQKNLFIRDRIGLYFNVGAGIAYFKDDYIRLYDDTNQFAPGLFFETGLIFRNTKHLRPFINFRGISNFSKNAVDDKWLEFSGGIQYAF
jgi:hypothetical protein